MKKLGSIFILFAFICSSCMNRDGEIIDMINAMKQKNASIKLEITNLQTIARNAIAQINKIADAQIATDTKISAIQTSLSAIVVQLNSLGTQITTANVNTADIKTKVDALQVKCSDLLNQIDILTYQIDPEYYNNKLKSNLVAYYPFNGNTNDLSSNSINATIIGANFTNDHFNNPYKAIEFPNNGVLITNRAIQDVINNFTVSIWAYTKNITPLKIQGFLSEDNGVADGPPIIHPTHGSTWDDQSAGVGIIFGTNQIQVVEHTTNYVFYPLVYSGNFSGWNHIVVAYENKIPSLYLNGKLMAQGIASKMKFVRPSNGYDKNYNPSGFGRSFFQSSVYNSTRQFNGYIDEYIVWDRILSPTEIYVLNSIDFKY